MIPAAGLRGIASEAALSHCLRRRLNTGAPRVGLQPHPWPGGYRPPGPPTKRFPAQRAGLINLVKILYHILIFAKLPPTEKSPSRHS